MTPLESRFGPTLPERGCRRLIQLPHLYALSVATLNQTPKTLLDKVFTIGRFPVTLVALGLQPSRILFSIHPSLLWTVSLNQIRV